MAAPLEFKQTTELGGCVLTNHTPNRVHVQLEYEDDANQVHLVSLAVEAQSLAKLPSATVYRIVHKETRETLLRFESWQFALLTHTKEHEFVIKYVRGPQNARIRIEFFPASVRGLQVTYRDPIEVKSPAEWIPGDSYRLKVDVPPGCIAGKLVMRTEDKVYESMIPWSSPSFTNPLYSLGAVAAPLMVQSVLAAAVSKLVKPDEDPKQAMVTSLIGSLMTMHGPSLLQDMSRGVSVQASEALPRPGDAHERSGLARMLKNSGTWAKIVASVAGTAVTRPFGKE